MNDWSGIFLTSTSYSDDWLKRWLGLYLWGYPKLIDFVFQSTLAEVRSRNLEVLEEAAPRSEPATDALNGRDLESTIGRDAPMDPSQLPPPSHGHGASMHEEVQADDLHSQGRISYGRKFHTDHYTAQTNSSDPSAGVVNNRHSAHIHMPFNKGHTRDLQDQADSDKLVDGNTGNTI